MNLAEVFRSPIQAAAVSPEFWQEFIPAASGEFLLPTLHSRLIESGTPDLVPDEIRAVLGCASVLNAERNHHIVVEAIHVARILNQIGIQPVVLKGVAYLLAGIYPDRAKRYLLDIDLLLCSDGMSRAVDELREHGYSYCEAADLVQFRHHHPSLRRLGKVQIELHHRVGQGVCDRLLPAATILATAKPLEIDGATVLIPSPTNLVNHLILHSQLAHPYSDRIFPPIRALVDLAQIEKRFDGEIDWAGLAESYRNVGQLGTLVLHLKHAERALGLAVPAALADYCGSRIPLLLRVRWWRRVMLNRWPQLRWADPVYWFMSVFSRRWRLVPAILKTPDAWGAVAQTVLRGSFCRALFRL